MEEHIPLRDKAGEVLTSTMWDGDRKPDSSRARHLPNLPLELQEVIVNELEGENEALKQCALTCRLYRYLAQKLLFKSVVLEFNCEDAVQKFLGILQNPSQLSGYVKHLSIGERHGRHEADRAQMLLNTSIAQIIPALTNVVDLLLGGFVYFWFTDLKPSLQLAIIAKCESLLGLMLVRVKDVPLKIFDHLPRLEKIDIHCVAFANRRGSDPHCRVVTPPCRIKDMRLADANIPRMGSRTVYPFFMEQKIAVGLLQSLSITMDRRSWEPFLPTDIEAVKGLIRNNAESLRFLEVIISEHAHVVLANDEPMFHVSKMPALEEFAVGGVLCNSEIEIPATGSIDFGWLSRHLETIPSGRKLNSVVLRIAIFWGTLVTDDILNLEGLAYFENLIVDKVLPQADSFYVKFKIWDRYGDIGPVAKQMQERLPTLQGLNVLHFEEYRTGLGD
ncbi:hypothetical protein D9613_008797 [Agrocybe pediades]|uniref:F-box domain-containing protein n=1 Tax=Agrocybe pediades TaxID=84607 RepID=A0A8H4VNY8_9AGAR|nr:hypothetical protein D9613_008797 [Agrocybe pediades]